MVFMVSADPQISTAILGPRGGSWPGVFLAFDCPARGHRVKAAASAGRRWRDRLCRPCARSLASAGSEPVRKT